MDKNVEIGTVVAFEAAHRQYLDESKCGRLHGHNWKVKINIIGPIGPLGYVIDFKDLKEAIVSRFDHKVILAENDPLVKVLKEHDQAVSTIPANPTCENLAWIIQDMIKDILPNGHKDYGPWISIRVWENDISYADTKGW